MENKIDDKKKSDEIDSVVKYEGIDQNDKYSERFLEGEIFNGMIADQSPEIYFRTMKLIKRAQVLRELGYDLCLAFDDGISDVVKFWEDVADQIRKVATIIVNMSEAGDVRTVGDLVEDYSRVIGILSWPLRKDAEIRLNKIFRVGGLK